MYGFIIYIKLVLYLLPKCVSKLVSAVTTKTYLYVASKPKCLKKILIFTVLSLP